MAKRRKISDAKSPDMFMLAYASLATLLLAFFIVLNTFTEEKKKIFIDEFSKSMKRREITFGLSGLFPRGDSLPLEDIQDMKYIYTDDQGMSIEGGDKGVEQIDGEEARIPAAVAISFNENDATLSLEGRLSLNKLIDLIGARPCSLMIEGHTRVNFIPTREYPNCWKLSLVRAQAVADYLHDKGKISFMRMSTVGYGNNKPVVKDAKSDKNNDRVSIIINVLK